MEREFLYTNYLHIFLWYKCHSVTLSPSHRVTHLSDLIETVASLLSAVSICLYLFSICFSFRFGKLWRTASCLNLSCRVLADMNSCEDLKQCGNDFNSNFTIVSVDLFFSCWIALYRSGIMLINLSTSLGRSRRRYQVKHWDILTTKFKAIANIIPITYQTMHRNWDLWKCLKILLL